MRDTGVSAMGGCPDHTPRSGPKLDVDLGSTWGLLAWTFNEEEQTLVTFTVPC